MYVAFVIDDDCECYADDNSAFVQYLGAFATEAAACAAVVAHLNCVGYFRSLITPVKSEIMRAETADVLNRLCAEHLAHMGYNMRRPTAGLASLENQRWTFTVQHAAPHAAPDTLISATNDTAPSTDLSITE